MILQLHGIRITDLEENHFSNNFQSLRTVNRSRVKNGKSIKITENWSKPSLHFKSHKYQEFMIPGKIRCQSLVIQVVTGLRGKMLV